MLDLDDLTVSLAGLRDDPFTCRAADLERLVEASAAAGFKGVSLWSIHAEQAAEDGLDGKGIARLCARLGIQVRMVEALSSWTGGDRAAIDAEARPVFALAGEVGAEEVLAVSLDESSIDLDVAAAGLAYLCDLAARHGLRVGLEFLPWTAIADLATAWALVERAARGNGGLVLDSWHWQRQPGGPDPDVLRAIPPDRIHVLQINDAPSTPDGPLADETMTRRLLPGDGDIDLRGLVDLLDEMGAEPMVVPEVFNREICALGPEEAARRMGAATRRVLAR